MDANNIPEGYKHDNQLIYGMRSSHPGLFEIMIYNPKKKNAIGTPPEQKMWDLIKDANTDEKIKVILIHGGKSFSSGNDLSAFIGTDPETMMKMGDHGVNTVMVGMLMAMATCKKPIVTLVRGIAMGIGFTLTAHSTFLYCSPDAKMMTPFMASSQSPEGTSTLLFPRQFGTRLANEILLTDKWITAQEAQRVGYINGIIEGLDPQSNLINPDMIPVIPKLLATDYKTLTNCMEQINLSKGLQLIEEVTRREGKGLVAAW